MFFRVSVFVVTFFCTFFPIPHAYALNASQEYEQALASYSAGDENAAFVSAKSALQQDPDSIPIKLLLAQIYFDAANLDASSDQLTEALNLGADPSLVLPQLGSIYVIQSNVKAFKLYEEYYPQLSKYSQFEWLLLRSQIRVIEGQQDAAIKELNKALELYPNQARALHSLASRYLAMKNYSEASSLALQAKQLEPSNEATFHLLGMIAQSQGQYQQAYDWFNQGLEIVPDDPLLLRGMVMSCLELGLVDEAQQHLSKISSQGYGDPTAMLLEGYLLIGQGENEQAQARLTELLTRLKAAPNEDDLSLLFIQGAASFAQNKDEQAQQYLQQYLKRGGRNNTALQILVSIFNRNNQGAKIPALLEDHYLATLRDPELLAQLLLRYIENSLIRSADPVFSDFKRLYPQHPRRPVLEAKLIRAKGEPLRAFKLLQQQTSSDVLNLRVYWLLKANLALQLNNYASAQSSIEQIGRFESETLELLLLKAALATKQKQLIEAKQLYEQILEDQPSNLMALFNFSLLLQSHGEYQLAEQQLTKVLELYPELLDGMYMMAENQYSQGRSLDAMDLLARLFASSFEHRRGRELQLKMQLEQNDWQAALETVKLLNRWHIHNPTYLRQYAEILIALERYDETSYPLELLSSLWQNEPNNLALLAQLQLRSNYPQLAMETMNRALELKPNQLPLEISKARLLLQAKRFDELDQLLVSLQYQHGSLAPISLLVADYAMVKGNNQEALEYWTKAIEQAPNQPSAYLRIYQYSHNVDVNAAKHLETLLLANATQDWHQRLLADTYLDQGKFKQAGQLYEDLLSKEQYAKDAFLLNNLANIYAQSDKEKALTYAQKSLELNARDSAIQDTVGWLLVQKGEVESGLSYLRTAFALDSQNPEIQYHLGFALLKLSRFNESRKELEQLIRAFPNSDFVKPSKDLLVKIEQSS